MNGHQVGHIASVSTSAGKSRAGGEKYAVWTSSKAPSYSVCMKSLRAYTQLADPVVDSNERDKAERTRSGAYTISDIYNKV